MDNIEAAKQSVIVTKNIQLIPRSNKAVKAIAKAKVFLSLIFTLNIIHWPLLVGGTIFSIYLFVQEPTLLLLVTVLVYFGLWLSKVIAMFQLPRYGVVSSADGTPQASAVIQLTSNFDGVEQHVLSTITDSAGHFILLAKPGAYQMTVTKEGFTPLTRAVEADEVNVKISLQRLSAN